MAAADVSLKLLIDTKGHKVLFAEAGKDFVDFLFNILTLPVGTVVRLLTKEKMVGCLGNLYESIETMNGSHMQPNSSKDSLLKPKAPSQIPLLLPKVESSAPRMVYMCHNSYGSSSCRSYVADDSRAVCPNCRNCMTKQMTFVSPAAVQGASSSSGGGYVKEVMTYMVMDDLVVNPMSAISSITLLSKFKVKDVGALEEKVIHLGFDEAVKLLKASLHSKTVLSDLFLGKKVEHRSTPGRSIVDPASGKVFVGTG